MISRDLKPLYELAAALLDRAETHRKDAHHARQEGFVNAAATSKALEAENRETELALRSALKLVTGAKS